jgi:hypothetical protein
MLSGRRGHTLPTPFPPSAGHIYNAPIDLVTGQDPILTGLHCGSGVYHFLSVMPMLSTTDLQPTALFRHITFQSGPLCAGIPCTGSMIWIGNHLLTIIVEVYRKQYSVLARLLSIVRPPGRRRVRSSFGKFPFSQPLRIPGMLLLSRSRNPVSLVVIECAVGAGRHK